MHKAIVLQEYLSHSDVESACVVQGREKGSSGWADNNSSLSPTTWG